jgi:hypothetical protein
MNLAQLIEHFIDVEDRSSNFNHFTYQSYKLLDKKIVLPPSQNISKNESKKLDVFD